MAICTRLSFIIFLVVLVLSGTETVFAQAPGFQPLVNIPGITEAQNAGSFANYLNTLYILSISVAAFLAVVMIIYSGVQYMLSDVVTDKSSAKQGIRGALLGLLIVIGAVIILETINPALTDLNVLSGAQRFDTESGRFSLWLGNERDADPNVDPARCEELGGTFVRGVSGTRCAGNDAGTGSTGDPLNDQIICEESGNVWDADATPPCRTPGLEERDLPSDADGIDLTNPANYFQLDLICSSAHSQPGQNWGYNPDTQMCTRL